MWRAFVWRADDGGCTPVQDELQASDDEMACNRRPAEVPVYAFKHLVCSLSFINQFHSHLTFNAVQVNTHDKKQYI